jgi:hypothetical protein
VAIRNARKWFTLGLKNETYMRVMSDADRP